jgi:hypothetical protein
VYSGHDTLLRRNMDRLAKVRNGLSCFMISRQAHDLSKNVQPQKIVKFRSGI